MHVMSFNSLHFWIFCAVACSLYYVAPHRYRWVCLLAASYYFYASFSPGILIVLVGLTAFVYLVTRLMQRSGSPTRRRVLLLADIGGPLLALIVFKYLDLMWHAVQYLAAVVRQRGPLEHLNILAPIGISFYVFKLLSYALDVYHRRAEAETHPGYFALWVAYFPQILAGPIERAGHLLPQFRQRVSFDPEAVLAGARLVAWGLFKKMVVADRLAYYVGEVFLVPQGKGLHLLFGAYFYYFQIYCDFSGYSDISVGISRILGLSSPQNFDYPYLSRSVSQFWTRWHITLSSWLRDYLFLPITYAVMRRIPEDRRWGIKAESWGYAVGMSVTMVLGGLWHGAALTFVVWGALHGVFLVASYAGRTARRRLCRLTRLNRLPRVHHALSILVTFHLITLAWIVFRATSFENLTTYIRYMQFRLPLAGTVNLLLDTCIVLVLLGFEYVQRHQADLVFLRRVPIEVKAVGYALFVVVLIALSVDSNNAFIYFRF